MDTDDPFIAGARGASSSTESPNNTGTANVPGPTGARMIAATTNRNIPTAALTIPNGRFVVCAMPSSNTKKGALPSVVADTSRYM